MQKGSPVAFGSGWKHPLLSHHWYNRSSVSPCSKFFGNEEWFAPGTTVVVSTTGPEEDARHLMPMVRADPLEVALNARAAR